MWDGFHCADLYLFAAKRAYSSMTVSSRLSPLEFVQTLGKLYRRANAVHSALEIPYARFRMLATRQLGIQCRYSRG